VPQGVHVAAVLWSENQSADFPIRLRQRGCGITHLDAQRFSQGELMPHRHHANSAYQFAVELESEHEAQFVSFFSSELKFELTLVCTERSISSRSSSTDSISAWVFKWRSTTPAVPNGRASGTIIPKDWCAGAWMV
jgi:hypothetical protein